jgi:hypothetical protein
MVGCCEQSTEISISLKCCPYVDIQNEFKNVTFVTVRMIIWRSALTIRKWKNVNSEIIFANTKLCETENDY